MATAVTAALSYFFGIPVFGFFWWLLNGMLVEFRDVSQTGDLYNLAGWLWTGSLVLYLVFGIFWLPRKIKEIDNQGGVVR